MLFRSAGVYDNLTSQVAELVNLPNPLNFRFTVKGEKLGVVAMDILHHKRSLNLRKGILTRHTLYQNSRKSLFDYRSLTFISMDNKNIGLMQIAITPLDASCELEINTGIDTSVNNAGVLTEGRKRHFRIKELGQHRYAGYLVAETLQKKHTIIYWSGFYYEVDGKKKFGRDNIFRLKVKKKKTVIFTKIFYIKRFSPADDIPYCKRAAFKAFYKVFHGKSSTLIKRHIQAWERLWDVSDIIIGDTSQLQQNLRFNIYHMLSCGNSDNGFSSIGARTLSGEGYRGHIFWDAEIFLMPFYLFTMPQVARNMLLYRWRRLDQARVIAQKLGYKGAMFPWESADTGEEETPGWAKDIDGSIVKIYTHKMEHHITADIAYMVYKYYTMTADEAFMKDYGYELLFETARFWASRGEYDKHKKIYHIRNVIGPDEFHINVDDNSYTNMMAKWNLLIAYKMFCNLRKKYPALFQHLQKKLKITVSEARSWKKTAAALIIRQNKSRVIEQFDGYHKLKKIILKDTDENGIPVVSARLKTSNLAKTQLIKQADVIMLLYVLGDIFSLSTKEANYNFYIKRALHKSSLSPSVYSIIASQCRDMQMAYNLFSIALHTDISNVYGNTSQGVHGACLGGVWQAVVFGFAGVSIKKEKLFINPHIPHTWSKIGFSLLYRGDVLKLKITNDVVKLKIISMSKRRIGVGIFGGSAFVRPNRSYIFKRKIPFLRPERHCY